MLIALLNQDDEDNKVIYIMLSLLLTVMGYIVHLALYHFAFESLRMNTSLVQCSFIIKLRSHKTAPIRTVILKVGFVV